MSIGRPFICIVLQIAKTDRSCRTVLRIASAIFYTHWLYAGPSCTICHFLTICKTMHIGSLGYCPAYNRSGYTQDGPAYNALQCFFAIYRTVSPAYYPSVICRTILHSASVNFMSR